jgi:ElaB/YqjD/DUF883 family membrane-anchored ribosome-binding protein
MGITKAVLGAVAAAGVARLLAPNETEKVMKSAKRAVGAGATTAKRRMKAAVPKAKKAATSAAKKATSKTKTTVRKAAKRPARKSR